MEMKIFKYFAVALYSVCFLLMGCSAKEDEPIVDGDPRSEANGIEGYICPIAQEANQMVHDDYFTIDLYKGEISTADIFQFILNNSTIFPDENNIYKLKPLSGTEALMCVDYFSTPQPMYLFNDRAYPFPVSNNELDVEFTIFNHKGMWSYSSCPNHNAHLDNFTPVPDSKFYLAHEILSNINGNALTVLAVNDEKLSSKIIRLSDNKFKLTFPKNETDSPRLWTFVFVDKNLYSGGEGGMYFNGIDSHQTISMTFIQSPQNDLSYAERECKNLGFTSSMKYYYNTSENMVENPMLQKTVYTTSHTHSADCEICNNFSDNPRIILSE